MTFTIPTFWVGFIVGTAFWFVALILIGLRAHRRKKA